MRFRDHWSVATVSKVQNLTPTIKLFELDPGQHYESWTPGSHIKVKVVADGRNETRTYSLIDLGNEDNKYHIAVKIIDDGLGGSRFMWSLGQGSTLEVSQPHNHFGLSQYSSSYTLVAGGVGITPMVSMARSLIKSGKKVRLFYGVRNKEEAAFTDLLSSWLGESFILCDAETTAPLNIPEIIAHTPKDGELYICGPIGMLEAAERIWLEGDHPASLFRFETFAASGHYPNRPFTVNVPRFDKTIRVEPHQTLLAALLDAGIEVMSDCKRGECGLCQVEILSNDCPIDHRDVFFSRAQKSENKKMCACVSRASDGNIIIDTSYRGTEATST